MEIRCVFIWYNLPRIDVVIHVSCTPGTLYTCPEVTILTISNLTSCPTCPHTCAIKDLKAPTGDAVVKIYNNIIYAIETIVRIAYNLYDNE